MDKPVPYLFSRVEMMLFSKDCLFFKRYRRDANLHKIPTYLTAERG